MRMVWRAFYTKPRHEKKVKDRLEGQGFTVYCPLVKTKIRWSDRWKKVYKPVVPGYLFALVDEPRRRELLQDVSILGTVFWNKQPAVIRDVEIRAMQYLLEDADDVSVVPLRKGERVLVEAGSFAGFDGVVMQHSKNTVCLRLEGLQCEFLVTVPKRHLKAVSPE